MSATINAPITLARDAYQLAMVELLKAGTLPADLPTRTAWLESLKATSGAVRYDVAQTLAAAEQAVARENVGIGLSDTYQAGAVPRFGPQGLDVVGDPGMVSFPIVLGSYLPADPDLLGIPRWSQDGTLTTDGMGYNVFISGAETATPGIYDWTILYMIGNTDAAVFPGESPAASPAEVSVWLDGYAGPDSGLGVENALGKLAGNQLPVNSGIYAMTARPDGIPDNLMPASPAAVQAQLGLHGSLTLPGAKTFSGQLTLTGQTATNGTSAMTRDLVRQQRQLLDTYDNWDLFGSLLGMSSGGAIGTGAYSTGGQAQSGSSVGGWARMVLAAYTTRPSGSGTNNGLCAVPIAVALMGTFSVSAGSALRIIFGAKASGTPYWSNQNPLAARGFGLEIYVSGGVTKMRLFTHNGTTFNYGTEQNFAGIWTGVCHLVIAHNGTGRVQLYHAGSDSHVALATPALQSVMTMTTGPTSGTYGEEGVVSMESVGNNTIASSALGNVMRGRMFLNHQL